ncbi:DNA polymerase III subunit beta [Pseudoflavonifractor intestinihominis]|uniref:Beta sliding clamp n=1 Tax=Pseudoflavonifractor intestinihominis TaxID=3133171 RepID=A0ABV1EDU1_9FIRM|nr:DNA polymerase III subunit beta [uncultured Pseudoflavonifractor sp.]
MKFTCEKALLQSAISTSSRAVSPKSSIPALEGILLEAGSELRLTGYNLETGIRTIVPADIQSQGSLVLSARLFGEIIRKLPDDTVIFTAENYMVNIKCGMSEFNILGTDPEEFPELPTVEYQNSFVITQERLKAMIGQTLFAVSDNESRPIHTGSLFEVDENGLTVVSVDGYRLALRHEPIDKKEGESSFSFVVPGAALSEVEKICSQVDEPASVTQGARHVMFKVGDTMLVARRLEGEFLAYRQAVPRNNPIHIEGDTRALLSSIDRVSLIISDKLKSPLRCVFEENLLKISTKTAIGDARDECPVSGDGKGLEIGFNNKYLMDALKAAPADRVRLELSTGVSPCVILPDDGGDNFLYMVLPVRLKAGE